MQWLFLEKLLWKTLSQQHFFFSFYWSNHKVRSRILWIVLLRNKPLNTSDTIAYSWKSWARFQPLDNRFLASVQRTAAFKCRVKVNLNTTEHPSGSKPTQLPNQHETAVLKRSRVVVRSPFFSFAIMSPFPAFTEVQKGQNYLFKKWFLMKLLWISGIPVLEPFFHDLMQA